MKLSQINDLMEEIDVGQKTIDEANCSGSICGADYYNYRELLKYFKSLDLVQDSEILRVIGEIREILSHYTKKDDRTATERQEMGGAEAGSV